MPLIANHCEIEPRRTPLTYHPCIMTPAQFCHALRATTGIKKDKDRVAEQVSLLIAYARSQGVTSGNLDIHNELSRLAARFKPVTADKED